MKNKITYINQLVEIFLLKIFLKVESINDYYLIIILYMAKKYAFNIG